MRKEIFEKIEEYLDGTISRQELENFALEGEKASLSEQIEWVRNVRLASESAAVREKVRSVTGLDNSLKKGGIRPWIYILAALLLLAVAAWFLYNSGEDHIYARYEFIDPGLAITMSESDQYDLYDALSYYNEGNYGEATRKLYRLKDESGGNDTIRYYLGATYLYRDIPDSALLYLNPVAADRSTGFSKRAQWMTALAYLRQDRLPKVLKALEPIVQDEEHPFHDQAQQLMREIQ